MYILRKPYGKERDILNMYIYDCFVKKWGLKKV